MIFFPIGGMGGWVETPIGKFQLDLFLFLTPSFVCNLSTSLKLLLLIFKRFKKCPVAFLCMLLFNACCFYSYLTDLYGKSYQVFRIVQIMDGFPFSKNCAKPLIFVEIIH
jgi:hypothetical protein